MTDALLELPPVGRRLAALDALELGAGLVELLLRARIVDRIRSDRVVDERNGAVLEHLEEARAGRDLLDVALERRALGRHEREREERMVGHDDADAMRSRARPGAASPARPPARS